MLLSDFDFPFDPTLIADRPIEPRDQARLLVLSRQGQACAHRRITDLPMLLRTGDLLVVNDTKVLPVRVTGRRRPGGGKVELLFVKELGEQTWEVLLKGIAETLPVSRRQQSIVREIGRENQRGAEASR